MSVRLLDWISIRIKVNVPVLKLFIKMKTWNLKYNPFCTLFFLFIFEGYYYNYLGWLLWGSTILPPKQNMAQQGQTHFVQVIIPNYEWLYYLLWTSGANKAAWYWSTGKKKACFMVCMSVYAIRNHASGSWLRNKQVANMQRYNTIFFS